jgi:hypothetical protein
MAALTRLLSAVTQLTIARHAFGGSVGDDSSAAVSRLLLATLKQQCKASCTLPFSPAAKEALAGLRALSSLAQLRRLAFTG